MSKRFASCLQGSRTMAAGAVLALALGVLSGSLSAGNPATRTTPAASMPTHEVPFETLYLSQAVTVTTSSQTLAELIGEALDADACKLQFVNRDTATAIHLSASDTPATTGAGRLAAGESIVLRETAADLATHQFIAGGDTDLAADVLIWRWRQAE